MDTMRRFAALRRLALLGICILLAIFLCKEQVFADANYKIKLNSGVENAVFTLSYTGEVDGLTIISPSGVLYDSSTCGTAYQKENGKIRIGVLYADPGSWQITIAGTPDDGFRLLVISDPDYGEYSGTRPSEIRETVPPETAATATSSTPGTQSAATSPVPEQTESTSGTPAAVTEAKDGTGTTEANITHIEEIAADEAPGEAAYGEEIYGDETYGDETASGMMSAGDISPTPLAYAAVSNSTDASFPASGRISGTVQDGGTSGTAAIAPGHEEDIKTDSPAKPRVTEGSTDYYGAVLFLASAMTFCAIVISVGEIVRGAQKRTPRIHMRNKEKTDAKIDLRDYFPEGK